MFKVSCELLPLLHLDPEYCVSFPHFYFFFKYINNFRGILYNVVLNIKLDKTNLNLGNLKDNVETHREHLLQVSQDLRLMTEKLEIVEKDLENVKGVKKDLEFINEVKEQMKAYTNKFASAKTHTSSGSQSVFDKTLSQLFISILFLGLSMLQRC